ncbi:MAG: hypothetical protein JNM17_33655 [Archangium sp.]|nr:hypothetical protein [Archangium sp.]
MRRIALLLGLGFALWATPARADRLSIGLDLGGGYWFIENAAQFDFHFKLQVRLGSVVSVGLRPGIMLNIRGTPEFGIPVDAYFRFHVSRLYFDILGGIAFLFNPQPFRPHVGVGMGVVIYKGLALGFEGGYLMNGANVLARLSWHF